MALFDRFPITIAQINPTVGDIEGNAARIIQQYRIATERGAALVVFPELALTGYPPEDLILMPTFRKRAMAALNKLAKETANGTAMIVGSVWEDPHPNPLSHAGEGSGKVAGEGVFNAAVLMDGGGIVHVQPKTQLPNYGVFDEKRLFMPGTGPQVVSWRGIRLGLLVCEDMWYPQLAENHKQQGAELLIVINASPFEAGKLRQRHEMARQAVARTALPLVYANTVGGQDDIVFDGGSFVMSAKGEVIAQAAQFEPALFDIGHAPLVALMDTEESLWRAMMMGLHDYVGKNGFPGVVLGLSGGIDSALSAAVAVEALGSEKVKGVLLPSPYTSQESVEDALHSAALLGIETMMVPITPGMEACDEALSPVFGQSGWMDNITLGGNVQARLRGMMLMAISNRFGWMLLSTGNKSEVAVGYSTLYGDSCGGYNVLKDLYKTQVYELARWRNGHGTVIPQRSITKAPSAELAPGQKDEDQLPPYAILDQILALHIEGRQPVEEIVARGFAPDVVEKVVKMVRQSEYKRRQSCPGVKLSSMLFGRDRRYPLTNKS